MDVDRYHGTALEPRPGLPSGHIPHSISLPFNALLESHSSGSSTYTTIREPDDLRKIIVDILGSDETLQPNGKRRIVNTCGSGMTAAIIWLALQRLGVDSAVYDEVRPIKGHPHLLSLIPMLPPPVLDGICRETRERDRDKQIIC